MDSIIKQYKPFFSFLIKFLAFYIVFTFVYKMYLNQFDVSKYEVDFISQKVAFQTVGLMNLFGGEAYAYLHEFEPAVKIIFNGKYSARIIEGCNAVSVIILFAAFVFAFSNGVKKTFVFILLGSFLIYVLNIVRIALLTYALYYYPDYEELLHGTVFPLFIYGVVFLLWVLWVTKFSGYGKSVTTK